MVLFSPPFIYSVINLYHDRLMDFFPLDYNPVLSLFIILLGFFLHFGYWGFCRLLGVPMSFGMYFFFSFLSISLLSSTRTPVLFCIFPTLDAELTISLRRPGFFYGRKIFRNKGQNVRYSHCFCSVTDSSLLSGQS